MDLTGIAGKGAFRGQAAIESPSATARPTRPSGRVDHLPVLRQIGLLRAQAAIEALSYGAFFMLIFVGAVAVFLQMQSQDLTRAEYTYAQQIAYGFADQIYVTSLAGTGFSQTVKVPGDLLGKNYSITISRPISSGSQLNIETGFVYVEWLASNGRWGSVSAPTITTRYDMVTYDPWITNDSQGFVVISSGIGQLNLTNNDGTIRVSNA